MATYGFDLYGQLLERRHVGRPRRNRATNKRQRSARRKNR